VDAIGTQTEAVAVRGLSLSHAGIGRLIGQTAHRAAGSDPAYGSDPLAMIVQDALSLLSCFGCVTAIVL
jgi:magnesium transporter